MTDELMSLEEIDAICEALPGLPKERIRSLWETARAAHEWKAQCERNEIAYSEAMAMSEKHRQAFSETLGRAIKAEQENEALREKLALSEQKRFRAIRQYAAFSAGGTEIECDLREALLAAQAENEKLREQLNLTETRYERSRTLRKNYKEWSIKNKEELKEINEILRARLESVNRIAACGSVNSFLASSDESKRQWFSIMLDESERRKAAEEENENLREQLNLANVENADLASELRVARTEETQSD